MSHSLPPTASSLDCTKQGNRATTTPNVFDGICEFVWTYVASFNRCGGHRHVHSTNHHRRFFHVFIFQTQVSHPTRKNTQPTHCRATTRPPPHHTESETGLDKKATSTCKTQHQPLLTTTEIKLQSVQPCFRNTLTHSAPLSGAFPGALVTRIAVSPETIHLVHLLQLVTEAGLLHVLLVHTVRGQHFLNFPAPWNSHLCGTSFSSLSCVYLFL